MRGRIEPKNLHISVLGAARVRVRENEWENVLYIINGIIHICTKQQKEVNHMKAQSQQKKKRSKHVNRYINFRKVRLTFTRAGWVK